MASGRRAAGVVGLAVIGSRILGLVRELVFAALFGATQYYDAFLAAFQIPNLMRDLFAEGALSTAFTATFAKTQVNEGQESAWGLASLLFSTLLVGLGLVCIAGIAASPLLVQITSFGFHQVPGKFELTVRLTRVLFPFILLVSLAAMVMGILNARFIFGLPASASTVFNLISVIGGVRLAFALDPPKHWAHPSFSERGVLGLSLGVLAGGLAQLVIQLPALWRLGYRFRWRLAPRDPRLRQVWALMWPSLIAGAAVQVNVMINGMFASEINGARSWLHYAFRLMQFPIGVFGVAIATVTLPAVARHHARSDLEAVGRTVEESLRLAVYLTVPAAVGLFVLAPDIIGIVYERGCFSAADTARTAAALRAFSVGLAGYASIKVLVPCFYALNRPRTPLRVSLLAMGLNAGLNLLLVKGFGLGHVGLAVTTGVLALVNVLQLVWHLRRLVAFGTARAWGRMLLAVGTGSALCGVAAWGVKQGVMPGPSAGVLPRVTALGAAVGAGALTYFGAALAMGLAEAEATRDWARRLWTRLRRARTSASSVEPRARPPCP